MLRLQTFCLKITIFSAILEQWTWYEHDMHALWYFKSLAEFLPIFALKLNLTPLPFCKHASISRSSMIATLIDILHLWHSFLFEMLVVSWKAPRHSYHCIGIHGFRKGSRHRVQFVNLKVEEEIWLEKKSKILFVIGITKGRYLTLGN